ncbi:MAG: tRNA(His) guanylyltransferase Thg1 family protein [Sandaracinaceae bacterium]
MKFEQLDRRLRVFETAYDHRVLPGLHMVARIDGRSFSQLTRDAELDAPYDRRFSDAMEATLVHLTRDSGFSVLLGYTQSDEMSLLFRRDEALFARSLRKFLSVLAGEASAKFSLTFGRLGAFDARVSQLPSTDHVVDYFRWRQEDAMRNAINGHAYWLLRRGGLDDRAASEKLRGVPVKARHELLYEGGIQFSELPLWQRRGIATRWVEREQRGENPKTGAEVVSLKRELCVDRELPMKEAFEALVRSIVDAQ